MGKISVLTSRHDKAIEYYSAALTLDPLLWCAYEELCNLGELCTATTITNLVKETTLLASNQELSSVARLCSVPPLRKSGSCTDACSLP